MITVSQIPNLLDALDSSKELRQKVVLLFESVPGIGKSEVIEAWAKEKEKDIIHIIGSQCNPTEISGIAVPDYKTSTMKYLDAARLAEAKDGDVLFFDELWQSPKQVLQAMLTLLQGRRLASGRRLADVIIVAAANPTNKNMIEESIQERFTVINVIKEDDKLKYLSDKYTSEILLWSDSNSSPRTIEKQFLLWESVKNCGDFDFIKSISEAFEPIIATTLLKRIKLVEENCKEYNMKILFKLLNLENEDAIGIMIAKRIDKNNLTRRIFFVSELVTLISLNANTLLERVELEGPDMQKFLKEVEERAEKLSVLSPEEKEEND